MKRNPERRQLIKLQNELKDKKLGKAIWQQQRKIVAKVEGNIWSTK